MHNRKRILVFIDWFEPGFKAGGPIRSIANFANLLQHDLDIFIVTGDRDVDDQYPYPGITTDKWIQIQQYQVYYASPRKLSLQKTKRIIKDIDPDWLYANAMFSWTFSMLPVLANHFSSVSRPLLLAPRGMLKPSALQFKGRKKSLFLRLYKFFRFDRKLTFQATSASEWEDIETAFRNSRKVLIPNLPGSQKAFVPVSDKRPGSLNVLFVGRIHPIKRLDFLLDILSAAEGQVSLTIVGKVDDADHWEKCRQQMERMGASIKVTVRHHIVHHDIQTLIVQHHLFFLPTQGENFGHAIFEALSAGRPVLISDQTPWRHLSEQHAGWDISLERPEQFGAALSRAMAMDNDELNVWGLGAWKYCQKFLNESADKGLYLTLFGSAGS